MSDEGGHIKPNNVAGRAEVQVGAQASHALPTPPGPVLAEADWAGPAGCLRRQSWGQMWGLLLSTASQWLSGQVLMLGEQVEKFLEIPVTHSGRSLPCGSATLISHSDSELGVSRDSPAPPRPEQ